MIKHWFSDVPAFRRNPLGFFLDKVDASKGGLEPLRLGPSPIYLVTDSELVKPILKTSEDQIDKGRLIHKLRPVVGMSSLTISGPEHRRRRHALHRQLARGTAQQFVPEMAATVRRLAVLLARQRQFDAHAATGPLALKLICVALFGHEVLSPGDERALIEAVRMVEDDLAEDMFRVLPISPWGYVARQRRLTFARAALGHVVQRVRAGVAETSVLRSLEELGLSDDEIRDEILTMLLAGHHTTASAAGWLLYHLASETGLADSIAEEAARLSGPSGEISPQSLKQATVSAALVSEVLRLYPSAWWFSREVKEPFSLAGQRLRPGTSLIVSTWGFHRSARYWDKPQEFRLDRSYGGSAYLPFGAGPRACVGMGVALLELQLVAIELAATYKFVLKSQYPAPLPKPSITLVPPPIEIGISLRKGGLSRSEAA